MQKTLKEWISEYPESDKDGLLNTRVLGSLEWNSYIKNIENLVTEFNLDSTKIDLNFQLLKKNVRNRVAHEGRMTPFENAHDLLDSLRFGLRLVILKKLRYEGNVQYHENGWRRYFKINYFFKAEENTPDNKT